VARAFNGHGQLPLVPGTGAGDTAGNNLCPLAEIPSQAGDVFVIYIVNFIHAEGAYFFSALSSATAASAFIAVSFHDITSFEVASFE